MAKMNFENALEQLEQLVNNLEKGEVSLEESLKCYEQGVKLANFCQQEIEKAKKKVEILVKNEDGSLSLEDFDENQQKENVVTKRTNKKTIKKDDEPSLF